MKLRSAQASGEMCSSVKVPLLLPLNIKTAKFDLPSGFLSLLFADFFFSFDVVVFIPRKIMRKRNNIKINVQTASCLLSWGENMKCLFLKLNEFELIMLLKYSS